MESKKHIKVWTRVNNKLLGENAIVELMTGEQITICRYTINKNVSVPLHQHGYEQTLYVTEGEMNLFVNDEKIHLQSGDAYVILGNEKHSAEITKVPYQAFESYCPIRLDLIEQIK